MNDTATNKALCNRMSELLSGYLDGELTQQESQQVNAHIQNCESCRANFEELAGLKSVINNLQMPEMEADKIEKIMNEPLAKASHHIGWSALIIGLAIALIYAVTSFYANSTISLGEKILISLIGGGLLGVFLSVARQQWLARKTDKYKGVKL
jgi:predicted anti-sigma-YlaC factor YlaD